MKTYCGYSLEAPQKNISTFWLKNSSLPGAMFMYAFKENYENISIDWYINFYHQKQQQYHLSWQTGSCSLINHPQLIFHLTSQADQVINL